MFSRITRSKARKEKGETSNPQPQQQRTYNVDPDSDPESDGEYDPSAQPLEIDLGFRLATRRMFLHAHALNGRKFQNTRLYDEETLDKLGMGREIAQLLAPVGFTHHFSQIRHKAYRNLTIEFLSSLRLKTNENGHMYIKFRLGDEKRTLFLADLARYLDFEYDNTESELTYQNEWDRMDFWSRITGLNVQEDFKSSLIQHPTIRTLHRILVSTIYARGETMHRVNEEDALLLDNILRPNPVKINFTYLMVKYWLQIPHNRRDGGYVSMGAYVTLLAKKFRLRFDRDTACKGYSQFNLFYFKRYQFIRIENEGEENERYLWLMPNRAPFYLPYTNEVHVAQPETWLVPADYVSQPPEQSERRENSPFFDNRFFAGGSAPGSAASPTATSSRMTGRTASATADEIPPWLTPVLQSLEQLNRSSTEAREELRELQRKSDDTQRDVSAALQNYKRVDSRLTTLEGMHDDFKFFKEHGYWKGGYNDPDRPLDQGFDGGQSSHHSGQSFHPSHHSGQSYHSGQPSHDPSHHSSSSDDDDPTTHIPPLIPRPPPSDPLYVFDWMYYDP